MSGHMPWRLLVHKTDSWLVRLRKRAERRAFRRRLDHRMIEDQEILARLADQPDERQR